MDNKILSKKTVAELKKLAQDLKITGISTKTKPQLIELISSKSITSEESTKSPETSNKEEARPAVVATVNAPKVRAPKVKNSIQEVKTEEKPIEKPLVKAPKIEQNQVEAEVKQIEDVQTRVVPQAVNPVQLSASEAQPANSQTRNTQQNHQNRNQNRNQNFRQDNRNNQNNQNRHNQNRNQHTNSQTRNTQQNNQFAGQADQMTSGPSFAKAMEGKQANFSNDPTVEVTGILDIVSDGTHGVLRTQKLIPTDKDTYISISQVKKLKLRKGDVVIGTARLPKENERYFSLLWIKSINGIELENLKDRPHFDDLKPVYPDKQMTLEAGQFPISNRIIDLLAPIGFGQRAMIVAPPKAGKTTLLKDIAKGINENQPDVTLMVVLIGERPEEVTDIERSVKGIVYASNFDDSPANQVMVAELSLERAKRMVESGQDVIILMDSLTRLARAYNVALPASGRTLSGGLDPVSLYPSKRFFGAARNFENGASLTIVATSLVDTGSKMDDVIFEEFKGTGNMELKLDRRMANKRIFPAINLLESGTRNEELLLGSDKLQNSWKIRRMLESLGDEGNEALIDRMKSSKSNEEFLNTLHQY